MVVVMRGESGRGKIPTMNNSDFTGNQQIHRTANNFDTYIISSDSVGRCPQLQISRLQCNFNTLPI